MRKESEQRLGGKACAITGVAMSSSLGWDVGNCCAAARAGLVRPSLAADVLVSSPDEYDPVPVKIHQAPILTSGFEGRARLARLLGPTLQDMSMQLRDLDLSGMPIGAYFSLPHAEYIATSNVTVPDDNELDDRGSRGNAGQASWSGDAVQDLIGLSGSFAMLEVPLEFKAVACSGHTGAIEVIQLAVNEISSGRSRFALVIAADSLCDEETLWEFENLGRLKTEDAPVGLEPGEAAVALLIESVESAQRRGAEVLGRLEAILLADESNLIGREGRATGAALCRIVLSLMERDGEGDTRDILVVSDQNGEEARAAEWGFAAVQITERIPDFLSSAFSYPASSFGDTGAASGAVSVCFALHDFSRNRSLRRQTLVLSASDGSERAGLLLRK